MVDDIFAKWNIFDCGPKCSTLHFCTQLYVGRSIRPKLTKLQNCICNAILILDIENFCCNHLAFSSLTLPNLLKTHTEKQVHFRLCQNCSILKKKLGCWERA